MKSTRKLHWGKTSTSIAVTLVAKSGMKKRTWRKQHRWLGYILALFLLMFCLSGIVLNHRQAVVGVDIGRKWLPARYRYAHWNGGLLRGTMPYAESDAADSVLVYGASGIWKTDKEASILTDFNKGFPKGVDHRQVRAVVPTPDGGLYAAALFGLYRYGGKEAGWQPVPLPKDADELLTDAVCRGDTLVVAGRSYLYISVAPYATFRKIQLHESAGYRKEATLFRTVWLLHSGELFGQAGKWVADGVAVVLIVLCLTGLCYGLLHRYIRRHRQRGAEAKAGTRVTRLSLLWHDKLGRTTLVLTLFIAVTGWCLRPPVLIFLALHKTPVVPGTTLDSPNPWHDKLRMVRYDTACGDWLLSTSDGFYALEELDGTPVKITKAPPVSVMGLNVLQQERPGRWLCGSFGGMFVWDRRQGTVTDYFTHEPASDTAGPPFGKRAVSGYSADLGGRAFAVEYGAGTDVVPQPAELATLPMSLWNVALEVHNGRIYLGTAATYFFVFVVGVGIVWCLWSGWLIHHRGHRGH